MSNKIWLNFSVKNIEESSKFFNAIGFSEMEINKNSPADMRGFLVKGSDVAIMMFTEDKMKGFMQCEISDTKIGNEMLTNIGCDTVEEVDEYYNKVKLAGGEIFSDIGWTDGWMYAFGFSDPSGHKWCPMFMDMSKAPQSK